MDTITITREQFHEAVVEAEKKFAAVGERPKGSEQEMINMMMSLQNILFGTMIGDVLFGDKKEEN